MIDGEMLYVFCYDIRKDGAREKVAELLEERLARVQKSVFEGRLSAREAERLGRRAAVRLGHDDSLRIYAIGAAGLRRCRAWGPQPLAEADDFYLL